MEYLKPIETLQLTIKRYQTIVIVLSVLLGATCIFVPIIAKNANPLIIKTDGMVLADTSPWKLSILRLEQFTKSYLSNRFEWKPENFQKQKDGLKLVTSVQVFSKLKDSLSSFESLTKNQGAKSYYVLEDFGFSNAQKKIEARITRVIRIGNVGVAIPLRVLLSYEESALTEANPYGLIVTGLEEAEITENSGK